MAWNPSPDIADLREVSRKWGYDQIIVLAIKSQDGTFKTASYGETKALCDSAKKIGDTIHERILNGDILID